MNIYAQYTALFFEGLLTLYCFTVLVNIFIIKGFDSFLYNSGSPYVFLSLICINLAILYMVLKRHPKRWFLVIIPLVLSYWFGPSFLHCQNVDTLMMLCEGCECRADDCFLYPRTITKGKSTSDKDITEDFATVLHVLYNTCKTEYCMILEDDFRQIYPWCPAVVFKDYDIIWQDARSVVQSYTFGKYSCTVSTVFRRSIIPELIKELMEASQNDYYRQIHGISHTAYDLLLNHICSFRRCTHASLYVESGKSSHRRPKIRPHN